jgi:hypothetical protein
MSTTNVKVVDSWMLERVQARPSPRHLLSLHFSDAGDDVRSTHDNQTSFWQSFYLTL